MKILKTIAVANLLIFHGLLSSLTLLLLGRKRARTLLLRFVHHRSKQALRILGIQVVVKGIEHWPEGSALVVANHMSYLDAPFLAGLKPMAFVTSVEMRNTLGLGFLTKIGGCLYVERRSKENIQSEIREISDALLEGTTVVVFPEATSTDGSKVLPFKRPLFHACVQSLRPIVPIVIQYKTIEGKAVTVQNRDKLCWYGSMDFLPHFLALAELSSVVVELEILPAIAVQSGASRDTLMELAQSAVHGRYSPIGD
jgi:lyso-ornithine lipid O-acyltransferase